MAYKSTRRQWVKLWVNEWLDGTTRFELTAPQRLLWVDLLALAGRSRFPGFVYAGTGRGDKKMGYPIAYLAGVLQMNETDLNNALKLLAAHNHITLDETGPDQFVVGIINWDKYQSEYLRQKEYRQINNSNKRSKSNGYAGGKFTIAQWMALVALSGNKCLSCGKGSEVVDLVPDHVIALAKGGTGDIYNIQPLCELCNRKKGVEHKDYRSKEFVVNLQHLLASYKKGYKSKNEQVTGEGEVDVEGEKRQRKRKKDATAAAFLAIGHPEPFGQKQFQQEWVSYFELGTAPYLNLKMENCIQRCQEIGIGVPPQFYEAKHEIEVREAQVQRPIPH